PSRLFGVARLQIEPNGGMARPEFNFPIASRGYTCKQVSRQLDLFGTENLHEIITNDDHAKQLLSAVELRKHWFGRVDFANIFGLQREIFQFVAIELYFFVQKIVEMSFQPLI